MSPVWRSADSVAAWKAASRGTPVRRWRTEAIGHIADGPYGQGAERRCTVSWPDGTRSTEKASDFEIVEPADDSRDHFSKLALPTPPGYHGRRR